MPSKQSFCRHMVSILPVTKRRRAFMFVLACLVWFSVVPQALGFIVFEHEGWDDLNTLITKVHEDQWVIHYSYGDNCPPEQRNNDAALTAAVTEALQIWLQPLREYTDRPIVNDFRYKLSADWNAADFGITFHCHIGASTAPVGRNQSPGIDMRATTNVALPGFIPSLLHEMGHIFGLEDIYTRTDRDERWLTKGGLDSTRGTQPEAIMASSSWHRNGKPVLGKDDKNGIIWLYKVTYEGLSIRDCFFTDYELEPEPLGCVPKHPLIFELKHGLEVRGLRMIEEDKSLDINAQDETGMTALHYAAIRCAEEKNAPDPKAVIGFLDVVKVLLGHKVILGGQVTNLPPNTAINVNAQDKEGRTALHHAVRNELTEVVKMLLAHADIVPFLRDNEGRSPLQIARENKLDRMITLLLEHPLTLPVHPKSKLTTTWGHLKKQY